MRRLLLATLAGVLYFLGFIGFGVWPLVFAFLATLLVAIEGVGPGRAFLLGTWTGFVAFCGGYYWVVHLLETFAGLSTPLALIGYGLLNLYQGMLWGVVAALVAFGYRRFRVHPAWLLPPAVIFAEWAFPLLFPNFIAASFLRVPVLVQIADLGGAYLVDGWIALVNGAVYALWTVRGRSLPRPAVAGAAAIAACLVYGGVRVAQVEAERPRFRTLDVALIQANLGEENKTTQRREFLARHQAMSRDVVAAHPEIDLIVWPEAAFNRAVDRRRPRVVRDFIVRGIGRPVLSGALSVDYEDGVRRVYNSAVLTSSTGEVRGWYDKVHLLAFGEALPLSDKFPVLKDWFPRVGNFDHGTNLEHLRLDDGTALLPMICYEDLLPGLVLDLWAGDGPPAVLVNVTNDSWYGNTHEPLIHLALATLRSVETRRALIRSTNTGISAIVDRAGRIQARTGQWTRETLVAEVPLVEDGTGTFYVRYGNWVCYLAALFWLGLLVMGTLRTPRAEED